MRDVDAEVGEAAQRTKGVSAAFVKELMRRIAQAARSTKRSCAGRTASSSSTGARRMTSARAHMPLLATSGIVAARKV